MFRTSFYYIILTIAFSLLGAMSHQASAQRFAVSTNALGYADLVTINGRFDAAVHRNISLNLGVKYNPFSWRTHEAPERQFQDRKRVLSLGLKYWPFYVYSGWYVNFMAQYKEFNRGGMLSPETYEGDAVGGGLTFGYAFLINDWFNIELGAGLWAGMVWYSKYALPREGQLLEKGASWFVAPNDLEVNFVFIF